MRRASAILAAIAAAAVCQWSVAAESSKTAESAGERTCRKAAREAGLSSAEIDALLQHATPAELAEKLKVCLQFTEWAQSPAYPQRSVDPAVVERGGTLYNNYGCTSCHGDDARGGERAPNLLRSERVMRDQKGETIGEVILKGVPGTAMPAFPLKPSELFDVAEFLHSLQISATDSAHRRPPAIVTGNAVAGRRYFERRCANCHSVAGDLNAIAAKYPDPRTLQQAWLMPNSALPATATVSTSGGEIIAGQLLHVDEFLVKVGLTDGTHRSFRRIGNEPKVAIHEPSAAHKALLPGYADRDIHDVTAYLVSLKSRQSSPAITTARTMALAGGQTLATPATQQTATSAAGLLPKAILNPSPDSWPTYSGDYSGRRYSSLRQINQSNVRQLTLAWSTRVTAGPDDKAFHPVTTAGEGKGDSLTSITADIRGSILQVNGVLYLSAPDNAWAVDARDGHVLWHFYWKTRGGMRYGNRGLGMWGNYLFLETPDAYLVSLNAHTGQERWHVEIASFEEQYYATTAPVVVGNHVLVGLGANLDSPGFLQSFDPQTGQLQWRHYSVPMKPGDPGLETWKDLDAARHGGGAPWVPGVYDPETNLYIYSTGNPTPAYFAEPRGDKDALFTCSLLAVDVDTGKRAWHYQVSPNDTHDWDASQTPVLADITIRGQPRKVVMTAARNGYFFVIDRASGEHLLTSKFSATANWARLQLNAKGQPVRIPEKDHHISGALVSNANQGAANWPPASYSPDYELMYVPVAESWAMYYQTETDPRTAIGQGGKDELSVAAESYLQAIDPKTGTTAWTVRYPSRGMLANGVLTTAGRLLFSGDTAGNLVARDPANGKPLWHTHLGKVSNAPQTYLLDGQQHILVAAGDMLYAFKLY